jgi:hypothetical protein
MSILLAAVVALGDPSPEHWFLDSPNVQLDRPDRLDPDEPRFELAEPGLRARAMFGGHLGIWGVHRSDFDFALALSPFVELVNLDTFAIPWQSFRANVGLTTMWRPHFSALDTRGGQLRFELGWHHESDHAAALDRFNDRFFPGYPPDNANFSAFEYVRASVDWTQDWGPLGAERLETTVIATIKPYPPAINHCDRRDAVLGMSGEVRIAGRVAPRTTLWVGGFGEWTYNRFVPQRYFVVDAGGAPLDRASPFLSRVVQSGVTFQRPRADLSIFALYQNSNSRTVDFFYRHSHEPGLGIRMRL